VIMIKTRDIPEERFYNFQLGSSFNTISTGLSFHSNVKGKTDWLGIDDGTRKLPNSIPDRDAYLKQQNNFQSITDRDRFINMCKGFNNTFADNESKALPGRNFQFSMGHRFKLNDKHEFGSIAALTYDRRQTYQHVIRKDFDNNGPTYTYQDDQYNNTVLWGALWNLSYKLGTNNKFSVKNIFNVNSTDQMVLRNGADSSNRLQQKAYIMWYSQSTLYSSQIGGEHFLPKSKAKLSWGGGYSQLDRIVPDLRKLRYDRLLPQDQVTPEDAVYKVGIQSIPNPEVAGRFYSNQKDKIYSGNFDFLIPFELKGVKNELKTGVYYQSKERNFSVRQFGYTTTPPYPPSPGLIRLPVDSIFAVSNIRPNGFMLKEVTEKSDAYQASSNLQAFYVKLDTRLGSRWKFIYGARVESYNQKLTAYKIGNPKQFNLDATVTDVLPSVNVVFTLTEKSNLRASAYQTVSRPEFRELAPFSFFDPNDLLLVEGNDQLKRSRINSYDLRYELYPNPGQVISVSTFYKYFRNPIEKTLFSAASPKLMTYQNVDEAVSYGFELDYRATLSSFVKGTPSKFLSQLTLLGNFSMIRSVVDARSILTRESDYRPMQGQSPYIINAGLQYNSKSKWGASVMVNRIGRRINSVGNADYKSFWENPRTVIDMQLSKSIKSLDVKLNLSDLLAQNLFVYQDQDDNKKFDRTSDNVIRNFNYGRTISFSLAYRFK
jgi:TonB-dependent receptor